jgi:hypothetical protein
MYFIMVEMGKFLKNRMDPITIIGDDDKSLPN